MSKVSTLSRRTVLKAAAAAGALQVAGPAIIELQSIIKNLRSDPTTPQAVAEMDRYLSEPVAHGPEAEPSLESSWNPGADQVSGAEAAADAEPEMEL